MRKPNFDFERRERDKAKAAKKAEKAAAKATRGQADTDNDANAPDASTLTDRSDLPKE